MQRGGGARRQLELAERPRGLVNGAAAARFARDGLPRRERRARQRRRRGGYGGGALAVRLGVRHLHLRRLRWVGLGEHQREDGAQHAKAATSPSSFFCASAWIAAASSAAVFASLAAPEAALWLRGGRRGLRSCSDGAALERRRASERSSGSDRTTAATARREERNGDTLRSEDRPRRGARARRCGRTLAAWFAALSQSADVWLCECGVVW